MKTVTITTIDDLLQEVTSESTPYASMNTEKIVRRAQKDRLLSAYAEIMDGKEVTIAWTHHISRYNGYYDILRISGDYNPKVGLSYELTRDKRDPGGELREFFGPEVEISSPNVVIRTDGRKEYMLIPYIPGDRFLRPWRSYEDYCKRSSVAWNHLKNRLCVGITGGTMVIFRPISVSLRKVPNAEVKMLAQYFRN
ncbi:hypothetical protein HYW21_04350 [Candidatus Woesearchaeota archaeon]|nr:hypothetical protein [Candidatus Woesearchaeota archaeon]